jgi:hypothetical protein
MQPYHGTMSKRRPGRNARRASRAECALGEMRMTLGYCIPTAEQEEILSSPPPDAEAFVDAVLVAEGLDPNRLLTSRRSGMLDILTKWAVYDGGHGHGSISDRPRFPSDP